MTKKKSRKYVQDQITKNFIEHYEQYVLERNPESEKYNTIFLSIEEDSFIELLIQTLDVLASLSKDDLVSSFLSDSVNTLRMRKGLDQTTMSLLQKTLSFPLQK